MVTAPQTTVLEIAQAHLVAVGPRHDLLRDVDLRLDAGQWAIVEVAYDRDALPLAPAAQGLVLADSGHVTFLGHEWNDRQLAVEATLRGRIGRVFAQNGWVSNLSVLENVVLSQRHHTRRPDAELEQAADELARRFDLHQVPRGRPANVAPDMLRRAEWVRALLGLPDLLLLEHPLRDAPIAFAPALARELRSALDRGAAAIWITSEIEEVPLAELNAPSRFVARGNRLERTA
jgi:phospholipid/cholesterol/gamma-HCH transport system ATP-binding protein